MGHSLALHTSAFLTAAKDGTSLFRRGEKTPRSSKLHTHKLPGLRTVDKGPTCALRPLAKLGMEATGPCERVLQDLVHIAPN